MTICSPIARSPSLKEWSLDAIQEDIRIWIEGKILLIWACVDLEDNAHDEAVLIFYFEPSSGSNYLGHMYKNITKSDQ